MKSDSLFYQIFQKIPELLGQLLGDDSTDSYTFRSIEVKGLARRIDGLFFPPDRSTTIFPCQNKRDNRINRQRHFV